VNFYDLRWGGTGAGTVKNYLSGTLKKDSLSESEKIGFSNVKKRQGTFSGENKRTH